MSDLFERARDLFLNGVADFESGRLADAERCFAASLQILPGRASTLTNLGAARLRLGRPAEALAPLDEAVAREPGHAEAWGHRGSALAALGRAEEALASFDRVLALAPGDPAALFRRSTQLNALRRPAEALASLDALLAARPNDAEAGFERAVTLQALGRPRDALAACDALLARRPTAAPVWSQRGGLLKDLGRLPEAAHSFRQALAHGADPELTRYLLASVEGSEGAPTAAPRAYVEGLFDGYAADFDRHLVDQLGYRTPQLLAALLPADGRWSSALDLGCGTGLMAPLLAPRTDALDGVDLSRQMLEKARTRGLYRELRYADVVADLGATAHRYGLVVAADVFVYVGALDAVFAGVARVLDPGGSFLFSVEEAADGRDLELRTSGRYAHGRAGLEQLAAHAGFEPLRVEGATLRYDQGRPITGLLLLLRRNPGAWPYASGAAQIAAAG
jgi:predicted TPR repeat methyltransferase